MNIARRFGRRNWNAIRTKCRRHHPRATLDYQSSNDGRMGDIVRRRSLGPYHMECEISAYA
jgi:hypothetical protein